MESDQEKHESLRRFLQNIHRLREQMNDEEFRQLRDWIEFVADKQVQSH
jgi:hypothetical protein